MNDVFQKIKELPAVNFPTGLHGEIMRRVSFLRLSSRFAAAAGLLALNGVLSGWHLWSRLAETEMLPVFKNLWEGFELSRYFFSDLAAVLSENFPINSFLIFLLNFLILLYVVYIYWSFQKRSLLNLQRIK